MDDTVLVTLAVVCLLIAIVVFYLLYRYFQK